MHLLSRGDLLLHPWRNLCSCLHAVQRRLLQCRAWEHIICCLPALPPHYLCVLPCLHCAGLMRNLPRGDLFQFTRLCLLRHVHRGVLLHQWHIHALHPRDV